MSGGRQYNIHLLHTLCKCLECVQMRGGTQSIFICYATCADLTASLIPRPPPRFYLTTMENNWEKARWNLSCDICYWQYRAI